MFCHYNKRFSIGHQIMGFCPLMSLYLHLTLIYTTGLSNNYRYSKSAVSPQPNIAMLHTICWGFQNFITNNGLVSETDNIENVSHKATLLNLSKKLFCNNVTTRKQTLSVPHLKLIFAFSPEILRLEGNKNCNKILVIVY